MAGGAGGVQLVEPSRRVRTEDDVRRAAVNILLSRLTTDERTKQHQAIPADYDQILDSHSQTNPT